MALTPDQLARAGRALHGELWQEALARDLDVAGRTMRRWASGEFPIPDGVRGQLRDLLDARAEEIGALMKEL